MRHEGWTQTVFLPPIMYGCTDEMESAGNCRRLPSPWCLLIQNSLNVWHWDSWISCGEYTSLWSQMQ
jgi:hypothetical protein